MPAVCAGTVLIGPQDELLPDFNNGPTAEQKVSQTGCII